MSTLTTAPIPARRRDEDVAAALLVAVRHARWPDGSLLIDLDDTVIRTQLIPHLMAALPRHRGSEATTRSQLTPPARRPLVDPRTPSEATEEPA